MRQRLIGAGVALLATTTLAGCESTQTKSARLASSAGAAVAVEADPFAGMESGAGGDVTVSKDITLLTDEIGTAAVVELTNNGNEPAYEVPVQLKISDESGAEAYSNATAGIQRSLTHAAVVAPGEPTFWVNDQIPAAAGAAAGPAPAVTAVAGAPEGQAPETAVTFTTSQPKLERDPTSGFAAKGTVEHDSPEEQRRVLVTVVARKDGKIVAAGRGVVARAKPGKRARFVAFFIGQPEGAELTASAQPDIDGE